MLPHIAIARRIVAISLNNFIKYKVDRLNDFVSERFESASIFWFCDFIFRNEHHHELLGRNLSYAKNDGQPRLK